MMVWFNSGFYYLSVIWFSNGWVTGNFIKNLKVIFCITILNHFFNVFYFLKDTNDAINLVWAIAIMKKKEIRKRNSQCFAFL